MEASTDKSDTPWLLLTFTLPTKRASQRVEVWRKLQRYGAVPFGNSGYFLPNNTSNRERVLKGWARTGTPDKELLERGMEMIEVLYHSVPSQPDRLTRNS